MQVSVPLKVLLTAIILKADTLFSGSRHHKMERLQVAGGGDGL
jgi:myosin-crossreactive antigen